MAAIACLRVIVDAQRTDLSSSALGALVLKFASAYLESRWPWPRQFAPLTNFAFLLTDPRSDKMDVQELSRMSEELQIKLFGTAADGDVTLLLFEGPIDAVSAFATLDNSVAVRGLGDPSLLPACGRLSRVVGPGLAPGAERPPSPARRPRKSLRKLDADDEREMPERLQGIYFIPQGVFIGDVIGIKGDGRTYCSIAEGPDRIPTDRTQFDAQCVSAALRLLATSDQTTVLYVPLSYDALVRPSQREVYEDMLSALPIDRKPQLAAAVYDVPRDPIFGALAQLRTTLEKYFMTIDLRIEDPGFEIEKLSTRAVAGVSLSLPNREARVRMSVLRHFASRRHHYARRQIWASVANVRTMKELDACAALGIPFVMGSAVSTPRPQPFGGRKLPMERLPVGRGVTSEVVRPEGS